MKSAAFAPDLRAGCVGREYAFRKCKFIPPHIEKIFQPNRNNTWVVPPKSTTNFLPFLSGSGREATAAKIPLDGIWLGAAGNSSTANGYIRICTNKKQGAKIPLLKVLEGS